MAQFTPDSVQKEPQLVIDITGSNLEEVYPGSVITKAQLITDVVGLVVEGLSAHDSQGADEQGGGGVMAITFSGGRYTVLEDLNPGNIRSKFQPHWGGSTWADVALAKADELYDEEFEDIADNDPRKPHQMCVFITDGELSDGRAVSNRLSRAANFRHYYAIVVGSGTAHGNAVQQWGAISNVNKNVTVEAMTNVTNAQGIASRILAQLQ